MRRRVKSLGLGFRVQSLEFKLTWNMTSGPFLDHCPLQEGEPFWFHATLDFGGG